MSDTTHLTDTARRPFDDRPQADPFLPADELAHFKRPHEVVFMFT